ncbi:MAG: DinB family protein [Armatimonadota bacterium]|nr:DinB family protein [Armatimonadota bacterium]MDR5696729.1 DinB family protein [Armatimonadota bacterium]
MGHSQRLLDYLEELREAVREAVAPLDEAQLNTQPRGLVNTPGVLLRHLAGSEREWIHRLVGGDAYRRDRAAEFDPATPVRKDAALAELEAVARRTREILRALPDTALDEEVVTTRAGRTMEVSKHYAILHTLAHYAYHHGQLRMHVKLIRGS